MEKTQPRWELMTRTNRSECPGCGDRGPHDDNGATGEHLTFCCTKCGEHFDAIIALYPPRQR